MLAGKKTSSYIHHRYIPKISSLTNAKYILLFCLFVFACQITFASGIRLRYQTDTTGPATAQHLNRKYFLGNYGKDDSSRALINFYFGKRNSAKNITLIGVSLAVVASIFALIAGNSTTDQSEEGFQLDDFFIAVFVTFLAESSIALLIIGAVRFGTHSRRKLLRLLKNYFSGHPIPPRIAKSKAFISLMREEKMKYHMNVQNPY